MASSFRPVRPRPLALALLLAISASAVHAQDTTANLAGRVTDAGAAVAGAQVTIRHLPSGTVAQAVTDAEGRYAARGLRVGGPYTVTITRDGRTETVENVFLDLAQTETVDAVLDATTTLDVVNVTAAVGSGQFSVDAMGAGTLISNERIESLPTIDRSIQDFARLDPRITQADKQFGSISALGQNNRFNQITIDGVTVNDTFGLQANNLPLLRQPVSMEAIEEIAVSISQYDTIQRGYTGAGINAVTRSGTNEFKGSIYYIFRDGAWGRENDDRNVFFRPFDEQYTQGVSLGGPIIKDRLFFFANYEEFKRTSPAPDLGSLVGVTTAQGEEAIRIARATYGIDAGGIGAAALDNTVEEQLLKLDWNIIDGHRASLRYTKTEQNQIDLARLGGNRLALSSAWFNRLNTFESVVGQIFSDWSDSLATEFKLSHREFLARPEPFSRLPQVQISTGAGQIALGTEQFRHANLLQTETWNAFGSATWFVGDHTVRGGFDYEANDIYNLFLQSSLGNYGFSSLADFAAGRYSSYLLRIPAAGFSLDNTAAVWELNGLGLFLQDTWAVSPNLNVTYGFRFDEADVPGTPVFNAAASARFGRRNDATIDGQRLFQPRFGFNYSFDAERPTQLRGGVGLFQGASANVWLSNPFTNNGVTVNVFGCGTAGLPACAGALPAFSFNPDNQPRLNLGGVIPQDVDFVADDLEQPAVWKGNLAFEHELPWHGLVASAEIILLSTKTGIHYDHLNLGAPTRTAPDGRPMFWNAAGYAPTSWNQAGVGTGVQARFNRDRAYREVLLARKTTKGGAENFSLSLQKPMGEGDAWFWQIGYAYGDARDVNQLAGSISVENWSSRAVFDPNEELSSRSNFATRDRFTAAASFRHYFIDGYKTEIGAFYEGRKGRPYSYVFDNDANGDGIAGNDLLYVPAGPGDVLFGSAAEEAAFWQFIANNAYLNARRGQVVGRNEAFSSWVNSVDLRISQDLPGFFDGHKAELWLDVLNVGNLINKDWGHIDEIFVSGFGQPQGLGVVEYGGIDPATGRYVYRFNTPDAEVRRDAVGQSRWALQLGFRYRF
ncbi:MAG TPA: Oar protein [Xanthomonadaceae bacterium]|jgi:hypothetical protein|nr:Oar protein [Xanthomonadaceae bacterium]